MEISEVLYHVISYIKVITADKRGLRRPERLYPRLSQNQNHVLERALLNGSVFWLATMGHFLWFLIVTALYMQPRKAEGKSPRNFLA